MKRGREQLGTEAVVGFPPLKSGGLIEAMPPAAATNLSRRFPPLKSGGLIEARCILKLPDPPPDVSSAEERRPH